MTTATQTALNMAAEAHRQSAIALCADSHAQKAARKAYRDITGKEAKAVDVCDATGKPASGMNLEAP